MQISPRQAFLYALGGLSVWWLILALAFHLLVQAEILAMPPPPSTPLASLAVIGLVIAPIVENAVLVGVLTLGKRRPILGSMAMVALFAALAHLGYGWRSLAAAGCFSCLAWYYRTVEPAGAWRAYLGSCLLHALFNAPAFLIAM